jgi:hypothetical protein
MVDFPASHIWLLESVKWIELALSENTWKHPIPMDYEIVWSRTPPQDCHLDTVYPIFKQTQMPENGQGMAQVS